MDKRHAQRLLSRVRQLPHWGLLIATVLLLVVAVFSLRANNQKMIVLRDAVFAADQNDGDVEAALRNLREHVYAHMNTSLTSGDNAIKPPIQLKYRYERLVAAEKARVEAQRSQVYTDAQNYCEATGPGGFSGSGRIPCVQAYVDSHQVAEQPISAELYMFDFASPSWSPDLAGWSLVLAATFMGAFLLRLASEYVLRQQLHH